MCIFSVYFFIDVHTLNKENTLLTNDYQCNKVKDLIVLNNKSSNLIKNKGEVNDEKIKILEKII